jgi:hypothetical protein
MSKCPRLYFIFHGILVAAHSDQFGASNHLEALIDTPL